MLQVRSEVLQVRSETLQVRSETLQVRSESLQVRSELRMRFEPSKLDRSERITRELTEIHEVLPLREQPESEKKAKCLAPLTVAAGGAGRPGMVSRVSGCPNCVKSEIR